MKRQPPMGDAGSGVGAHPSARVAPSPIPRAAPRISQRGRIANGLLPYLFVAPALCMLLLVYGGPTVGTVVLSFSDWDGVSRHFNFIGLRNFTAMLGDTEAGTSLRNTIVFTVVTVVVQNMLALPLALALNTGLRGRNFFRSVFFLPTAVSYVVASLVWRMGLFSGVRYGIINTVLVNLPNWGPIHPVDPIPFTFGAPWLWVVLITVRLWLQIGFYMIIFLAGLQEIPRHLYEAARVDGAEAGWTTFRHITFPLLRNTSIFVGVLLILNAFQAFDEFYNLSGSISSPDPNVRPPLLYLYNVAIGGQNYGVGSAGAFIVAFLIIAFTFVQLRLFGLGRSGS